MRARKAAAGIGLGLAVSLGLLLALRYGGGCGFSGRWPWLGQVLAPSGGGAGDVGPMVKFDPFLVTEWDGDTKRVSTITFEVELTDEKGRDAVKAHTSQLRSAVLSVLADRKLSEIGDAEDQEKLKQNVQKRLQALLPGHDVRRVLITEFLTW